MLNVKNKLLFSVFINDLFCTLITILNDSKEMSLAIAFHVYITRMSVCRCVSDFLLVWVCMYVYACHMRGCLNVSHEYNLVFYHIHCIPYPTSITAVFSITKLILCDPTHSLEQPKTCTQSQTHKNTLKEKLALCV